MITRSSYLRSVFLFATAVLILVAFSAQFMYGLQFNTSVPAYLTELFTYFTILSNLFVVYVFGVEAFAILRKEPLSRKFDSVRGAAVFCILITGVIHGLFLRGPGGMMTPTTPTLPWINAVFHYIVPILVVLDWTAFPPKRLVNWSTIFTWLGLTIVYLLVVELVGLVTHTYPYFFLNPSSFRGYRGIILGSAGFLPFFFVFGGAVLATANGQFLFRNRKRKVKK